MCEQIKLSCGELSVFGCLPKYQVPSESVVYKKKEGIFHFLLLSMDEQKTGEPHV